MQPRNKLFKILKFLGKAILVFLLVLLALLLIVHLPPVQHKITRSLSSYLSGRMKAQVDIDDIEFSILGHLSIKGVQVWDPDKYKLFTLQEITVVANTWDLITGKLIVDKIHLEGVDLQLTQREEGFNIQYILDAFNTGSAKDTSSQGLTLHFNSIVLENINIQYASDVNGTSMPIHLGKGTATDVTYSTKPAKMKADIISLQNAGVNILMMDTTTAVPKVAGTGGPVKFVPDFGLGIEVEINKLEATSSAFAYHVNRVAITPGFDPDHIVMKDIQFLIADILLREDTLAAKIKPFSAQLPGFTISKVLCNVEMKRDQSISLGLYLASGENAISGDLKAWTRKDSTGSLPNVDAVLDAEITPAELGYFLSQDEMKYFSQWKKTKLMLTGDYVEGKGNLQTLLVKTTNSEIYANGRINTISDLDKLSWSNLYMRSTVGPDFQKALTPYLSGNQIPPGLRLDLTSSGNLKKMFIDGDVNSTWGNVTAKGDVSLLKDNLKLDMNLKGQHVSPGHWIDASWLGPVDFTLVAKGMLGTLQDLDIKGVVHSIELMDRPVHQIAFESTILQDSLTATIAVHDPLYPMEGQAQIAFDGPIHVASQVQLDSVRISDLLHLDSTLWISGGLNADIVMDQSTLEGNIAGQNILIQNQSLDYRTDTLSLVALISPDSSNVDYYSSHGTAHTIANFDIQAMPGILKTWSQDLLHPADSSALSKGDRILQFDMQLDHPGPLQLLGMDIDQFTSLHVAANWDERQHRISMDATSGMFKGYGMSLDTIHGNLMSTKDHITSDLHAGQLLYGTYDLGDLDFNVMTKSDTAITNIFLSRDSVAYLGMGARVLRADTGFLLYPDTLLALGKHYILDKNNPVRLSGGEISMDSFQISGDSMLILMDGDMNAFDINFRNVDLTTFNPLLSADSSVITKGLLTGILTYVKDERLQLDAHVDSLSLYHSIPLTIAMEAHRNNDQVPFQFLLSNATNKVNMEGQYSVNNDQIDAGVKMDINNLGMFSFLFSDFLDQMDGTVIGEVKIGGTLQKPDLQGNLRFKEVEFTMAKPHFTFKIRDDVISMNNNGLTFDHFTFFDQRQHPLTVDGQVTTGDYKSFAYDLTLHTDDYTLLNKPASASDQLKGLLVVGADVQLKGNEKDTYVTSKLVIKDTTDLLVQLAGDEAEVLNTVGIVEFVDPGKILDSTALKQPATFYDSLITSLPDFNLNANITIENNARLKVIVNEQSGDYFQASGGGKLDLEYDRTGNAHLAGTYTIKEGVYRVSFYDLVKKNFQFVTGSTINWSGSPETGQLDIKAIYTVQSNSIGLVGNEIGENEKSVYKRSLDYEVGINISGTIEKPIVSFSLDLPDEEKANYPVLANKLERLKLPEFQTELNKQVFGLLVLGGFLPDASATDVNSNQIATTALYNSVNSLLASQLNRVAGQYIKGVNIDVGIQSYADYSTPGGKTQTAMDFRVSKSILDERLSFEVGGDFDINSDQSGANKGNNYRGDVAIIYDLTGNGDKQLKLFNNETYDIIYQEIRNTGISLVFIREFDKGDPRSKSEKIKDDKSKKRKEK